MTSNTRERVRQFYITLPLSHFFLLVMGIGGAVGCVVNLLLLVIQISRKFP